jgi:hypothetical protein
MKKLLTVLAIAAIAITSTFAATTGSVTLNSILNPTSYSLSMYYGSENFTSSGLKTVDNLDLTAAGTTDEISVKLTGGNLNETVTYTTTVTENQFTGEVDGETYTTNNNLTVINTTDGEQQTTYTAVVGAGPNDAQDIAVFMFDWDADTSLPAGSYSTTNTISITVV